MASEKPSLVYILIHGNVFEYYPLANLHETTPHSKKIVEFSLKNLARTGLQSRAYCVVGTESGQEISVPRSPTGTSRINVSRDIWKGYVILNVAMQDKK